MPKQLLTQREYAKHRGVTSQRISSMIKAGILKDALVKIRGQAFKKVDVELADRLWDERVDKARSKSSFKRKPVNSGKSSIPLSEIPKGEIDDEKTLSEKAEVIKKSKIIDDANVMDKTYGDYQKLNMAWTAALKKLEYEIAIGKLIDKKETELMFSSLITGVRNKIMGIHDRIGQDMGAEAAAVAKKIIWQALKDLSEAKI